MNKSLLCVLLLFSISILALGAAEECTVPNCENCNRDDPTKCQKCKPFYFLDAAKVCSNCLAHCEYCVTADDCITCEPNFKPYRPVAGDVKCLEDNKCRVEKCDECEPGDTTKCKTCTPGYFAEASQSQCSLCAANCTTCSGSSTYCIGCKESFQVNPITHTCDPEPCSVANCDKCVPGNSKVCHNCKAGFYNNSVGECKNCLAHCAVCDMSTSCIRCEDHYKKIAGLPEQCLVDNCQVENCQDCSATEANICNKCKDGFFADANNAKCTKCDSNCKTCVNSDKYCTGCADYFKLNTETHVCEEEKCEAENCHKCISHEETQCLECKIGFFPDSENHCKPCINHCELCETSITCIRCAEHYEVKGIALQKCIATECQVQGCATCLEDDANKCETCENKFYLTSDGKCESCDSNCLSCKGTAANCTSCPAHYNLNKETNKCDESNCMIDNCETCEEKNNKECVKCSSSFYLESKTSCKACSQNCLECTENASKCTDCHQNYKLNGEQCEVANCLVENCGTCEKQNATICISCKTEFVLNSANSGKCDPCPDGCQECEHADTCKTCKAAFIMGTNQKCDACPSNCKNCAAKDNCTTCETTHGVNKTDGKCYQCPSNCTSCNYAGTCDHCENDLVFDESLVKCTPHSSKAWLWILIIFGLLGLLVLIYLKVVRPRLRKVKPSGTSYGLLEEGYSRGGHSLSLVATEK